MGREIYTIGETVYDIIFKSSVPGHARAGGSMLNTSVSLGRLGFTVSFISELANDFVGRKISGFLENNHVNTKYIYKYQQGKTALALAFLDENNNADYEFYKLYPEKRLNIEFPEPQENDIILFGSFFALSNEVRIPLKYFIGKAQLNGSLIMYDPNFRKTYKNDLPELKGLINENISMASIVRGSNEDFNHIFNCSNGEDSYQKVKERGCEILIYTQGEEIVEFYSQNFNFKLDVPKVNTKSTIGAGDNFNAGLIYGLMSNGIKHKDITKVSRNLWVEILDMAIKLGSHVCQSYDNYISEDFANKFK